MAQAADRNGIVQIDRLTTQAAESMGREARRLHRHAERARALYRRRLGTWLQLRARLEHGPQRGAAAHNGANGANGANASNDAGEALHAEHETLVREIAQLQDRTKRLEVAARQLDLLVRYLSTSDATTVEPTLDTTDDSPAATSLRIIQAQEQERQRLAEEIHDGPAQVLTNAIFQVEYLDRVVASEPRASSTRTATTPQARAELALLRSMLRDGLEEVRGTIASLRPPAVDVGLDAPCTKPRSSSRPGMPSPSGSTWTASMSPHPPPTRASVCGSPRSPAERAKARGGHRGPDQPDGNRSSSPTTAGD